MSALDTFFSAWSETDADKRGALISEACAEDAIYSDPRSGSRLEGASAISNYVGEFAANAPGWTATVEKSDEVNGYMRALVAFGGQGPDGNDMMMHGTYFADLEDCRITMMAGFVGVAAPE